MYCVLSSICFSLSSCKFFPIFNCKLHKLSVLLPCINLARTLSSANTISVLADFIHGTPKIILPNCTSGDATRKVIFVAPNSREFSTIFLFIINSFIVMTPNIASLTMPVLLSMLRVEPIFFISWL